MILLIQKLHETVHSLEERLRNKKLSQYDKKDLELKLAHAHDELYKLLTL